MLGNFEVVAVKIPEFKPIHLIHAKVFIWGKHDLKKMKNWGAIKAGPYETWYLKDSKNRNKEIEIL